MEGRRGERRRRGRGMRGRRDRSRKASIFKITKYFERRFTVSDSPIEGAGF